jgi:hypothetical protein
VIKFLVEEDMLCDKEELKQAIIECGCEYKGISKESFDTFDPYDIWDSDVVFLGSLKLAKIVQAETFHTVFCGFKSFKCSEYYPYLAKYLLTDKWGITSAINLKNNTNKEIFIRPNDGDKVFTGHICRTENDYQEIIDCYENPYELVVGMDIVDLRREWRLVVVDKKIISGQIYCDLTTNLDYTIMPPEVKELGEKIIAEGYEPDKCWTIDIAQINDDKEVKYGLVEINSFSCAGLYGSVEDIKNIIGAVKNLMENKNG